MKKLIVTLLAFAAFVGSAFAVPVAYNETSEENWSDMTYQSIPVYKVLEGPTAFVVMYQKGKYGVGQTVLPKTWTRGNKEAPAKLKMRATNGGKLKPFITVVKKGGEFHHVVLTMPTSKANPAWGVVGKGVQIDTDKETLEELQETTK